MWLITETAGNFTLTDKSVWIVFIIVSMLNFSYSLHCVDENCWITDNVVINTTKTDLIQAMPILLFVTVDDKILVVYEEYSIKFIK